jgi:hypothetical protein
MSSELIAVKTSAPGSDSGDAIRIDGPDGRQVAVDTESRGTGSFAISGMRPPQNEEGAPETAALLVLHLRTLGQTWLAPVAVNDGPADCRAVDPEGNRLDVQVTRPAPADVWAALSRDGSAAGATHVDRAIAELKTVIDKKARIDPVERKKLVLAIDARDLPIHATKAVVDGFVARNGAEAAGYGFQSIWVVGPTEQLVRRLDVPGGQ